MTPRLADSPTRATVSRPRSRRLVIGLAVLGWLTIHGFTPTGLFASDEIPGKPQTEPIAIVNATIHPLTAPRIPRGAILFEGGKIKAIGEELPLPEKTRVIDGEGCHVYPGLFDAATILGLVEINSIRATIDYREVGSLNPNVRAWIAFNPDSEVIPVTRSNGILLSLVMPTGGLVSGRSAVMQLDGWTWETMALKTDVGLHIQWPTPTRSSEASTVSGDEADSGKRSVGELRTLFEQARGYQRLRQANPEGSPIDARLESMLAVLDGHVPIFAHADSLPAIQSAVAFATEERVRLVIVGGYDAPHCASLLQREKVPVIVTGTYRLPQRDSDGYDAAYTVPNRLRQAKVDYCLASAGRFGATGIRNLPYHAANAVAFGLPAGEALKAITLYPARILGVDDRVGSLEVGKDATLLITTGDPLEVTTQVQQAFIQGRLVDLNNRQQRLYRKYQSKYGDAGEDKTPQ
jgi:imidazolonepropionase-like amidohydrolase